MINNTYNSATHSRVGRIWPKDSQHSQGYKTQINPSKKNENDTQNKIRANG